MAKSESKKKDAPEQRTQVLIPAKTLVALLKSDDSYKNKIDGLVGELREEIGNAVEKKHLHKGAYAILKKLHRMEDIKLADLWDTLQAYMDMVGVMKRIESVPALPFNEKGDEAEDGGKEKNVVPMQRAAE